MQKSHLAKLGEPIVKPSGDLPQLGGLPGHGGGHALTSTREAIHDGHRIVVTTTYAITIDGEPLQVHVEVDDLGRVHCHALPNYNFGSALDMVKGVIDALPLAAKDPDADPRHGPGHVHVHAHEHEHGTAHESEPAPGGGA